MGNGRKNWDATYHFLTSLWEPINRLPEDRQMFLHMKIQEMIFQETQKQKGTNSSTGSFQMQLFHCEDGRSNQGERGQHLAQSFFQTFSKWQLCYIRSYLFFHYPTSHTLLWVSYHYLI